MRRATRHAPTPHPPTGHTPTRALRLGPAAALPVALLAVLLTPLAPVASAAPGGAGRAPATVPAAGAEPAGVVPRLAPVRGAGAPGVLPGRYVVVLKTGEVTARDATAGLGAAIRRAEAHGAEVTRSYHRSIRGYAARLSPAELAATRADPAVAYVEADRVVHALGARDVASWGLDRLDAPANGARLDGRLTAAGDGTGVTVYVVDTGIRRTHTDFGGRAVAGWSAIEDGNGTDDCNGHGTHVAGTIGGAGHGVAPGVRLVAVRVLDCDGSGSTSGVIAGIDWITTHRSGPTVVNLSLGGSGYTALDQAVARAVAAGLSFTVAAGNAATDACTTSPARLAEALTVAASTAQDSSAGFSNVGRCVDLYAPGQGIVSAGTGSDTALASYSGTSMAAPHVAGAAALYLQAHPTAGQAQVSAALLGAAASEVLTGVPPGTANRLLHLVDDGAPATPTPTPTPAPTPTPPPLPVDPVALCKQLRSGTPPADVRTGGAARSAYTTTASGTHTGCLLGPRAADYDLHLTRWNGKAWVTVASGRRKGAQESVSWTGRSGTYRWRVTVVSGSGGYDLRVRPPVV